MTPKTTTVDEHRPDTMMRTFGFGVFLIPGFCADNKMLVGLFGSRIRLAILIEVDFAGRKDGSNSGFGKSFL